MKTPLRYQYRSKYGYAVLSANRYESVEDFIKHIGYFASSNKAFEPVPCLDCDIEYILKVNQESY